MFPSANGLPAPLATLDEVFDSGDTSERPQKVFIGHNLGHRTFLMMLPMKHFFSMSEVANEPGRDGDTVSQRRLDPIHAQKLAVYILKGLISAAIQRRILQKKPELNALKDLQDRLGKQPYMALQPLVVNIRDCNPQGADIRGFRLEDKKTDETAAFKIFLSQRHVLWVIDGQHRRAAMKLVYDFIENLRTSRTYPKKGNLLSTMWDGAALTPEELKAWEECYEVTCSYCTLLLEIHLGLKPDEERQLFHDLNRLGKKVDPSLALQFDSSNPINVFIKDQLVDELGIPTSETDNIKDLKDDDGRILRKDLVSVNAILFLNKGNITGATRSMINGKEEIALRFWQQVKSLPGFGEEHARQKTLAAQPGMLKSIAKLVYDYRFSNRRPQNGAELAEEVLTRMHEIDFSHSNMMWRFFELSPEERTLYGLNSLHSYLPPEGSSNKDIGGFQGGFMRLNPRHNDIIPILGDMMRWKLGLPARRHRETEQPDLLAA